ncbi:MAG: sulfatase-like hydrolase/transferase, partial [Gemmatimonadetes bacterium]|nr:sulfatase-like hydrolase/transferase [Gemmatimonadota bacterium]
MRRLLLGGVITALLAGCGEEPAPPRPPAPPRVVGPAVKGGIDARGMNLLVILSDTHRADFTSPQDGGRQLTPALELLARDGIRFPHAYTITPTSAPSYASLLSGLHPEHHGVFYNEQSLSPEIPLLSEQLRADGYTTAAVIGNGYCSARYGFDRGWDWCWNGLDGTGSYGPGLTDRAIAWLDRRDVSKPFFLFTTYMECHVPFLFEPVPNLLVERNGEAMGVVRAENGHGNTSVPVRFPPGESVLDLRVLENGVVAGDPERPSQIRLALIRFGDSKVQAESFEGFDEGDGYFRRIDRHAKIHVRNSSGDSTSTEFVFRAVKDYSDEEMQANYERGVRSMDREVGRLLAALEARGLTERTVVVFLADHGEMLGEHDAWGHLKELYEEDIRIPLVLRIPGGPRGGVA